jgi:hypothetical protein
MIPAKRQQGGPVPWMRDRLGEQVDHADRAVGPDRRLEVERQLHVDLITDDPDRDARDAPLGRQAENREAFHVHRRGSGAQLTLPRRTSDDAVRGQKCLDNPGAAGGCDRDQSIVGLSGPAVAFGESLVGHENVPEFQSILQSSRHSGSDDHVGAPIERLSDHRIETTRANADERKADAGSPQCRLEERSVAIDNWLEAMPGAPRCALGIEREEDGDVHAAYGVTGSTRMPSWSSMLDCTATDSPSLSPCEIA